MRKLDSWGFDESIVEDMRGECRGIMVHDIEEDITYTVPFEILISRGFTRDFGHKEQRFLPRKFFRQWKNGELVADRLEN